MPIHMGGPGEEYDYGPSEAQIKADKLADKTSRKENIDSKVEKLQGRIKALEAEGNAGNLGIIIKNFCKSIFPRIDLAFTKTSQNNLSGDIRRLTPPRSPAQMFRESIKSLPNDADEPSIVEDLVRTAPNRNRDYGGFSAQQLNAVVDVRNRLLPHVKANPDIKLDGDG